MGHKKHAFVRPDSEINFKKRKRKEMKIKASKLKNMAY